MTEDLVQMAKDAARYRWLRENFPVSICGAVFDMQVVEFEGAGVVLDALVDAEKQ